jgi:tetratricopeptide (TPR) repeat protein
MRRILLIAFLLFALMVCLTSPAWAGGLDDAKAGAAAAQRGNYDEAIKFFTKAIDSGELSQEQLSAVYGLRGLAWSDKKDYDKAIADYDKAIAIDPKSADAYYDRGLAWYVKKDYDKAIADFTKVIEINPKDAEAYYLRGRAWHAKGDSLKAIEDYAKAKELGYK